MRLTRKTYVTVLAIACFTAVSPAGADAPACCRLFGIDATPILGNDTSICGEVRDADDRPDAESITREDRQRAAACARAAQAAGRTYVYTYRQLVSPDVDMLVQAVTGTRGERLLLKLGNFRGENIRSVEACAKITVLEDGRLESRGCTQWHPLVERLRAPFPVR